MTVQNPLTLNRMTPPWQLVAEDFVCLTCNEFNTSDDWEIIERMLNARLGRAIVHTRSEIWGVSIYHYLAYVSESQWRYSTSNMLVGYILSNVCLRLCQFSQLFFMQYTGLCVFNKPISLMVIVRIHVYFILSSSSNRKYDPFAIVWD